MSERLMSTRALAAFVAVALAATFGVAPAQAAEPPASRELQAPLTAQPEPTDARNPNPLGQIEQDEPTAELSPEIAITCNGAGGPWNTPGTWNPAQVPTAADSVTITTGCTVTIDTAALALSVAVQNGGVLEYDAAAAQSLTVTNSVQVQSGGTLRSAATGTVTTHVLSVGADLVNSGTLDFSTNGNTAGAGITFTGAGTNSFTGSGAVTNIRTLTINKGTSFANILDLAPANLTVQGTTTDGAPMAFLTLTNGTLRVSGTFTLAGRVFTAAAYSIPATAGFWLNNPNVTVSGQNGSPTNNGLLRVEQGIFNVGTASGNSMGAGIGSSFVIAGGTLNVAGRLNSGSTFVTYTQSGGTVNVSTVGNGAGTPSFGFTGVTGVVTNMSGGTINLVQAAPTVDYNQTGTMNYTGGTLNVGTGATAGTFLFRIQGQIPAVVLDTTTNNKNANLSGQGNVWGTLTVNPGTTLNLNGQTLLMIGPSITNNGAISVTTNNTSSVNFAGGLQQAVPAYAQTYAGAGTAGTAALRIASFAVQNPLGVTLDPAVSVYNTYRVNAFYGQITNASKIAIGNADAVALVVQRGATGIPFAAGSLDVAPVYSIGAGGLTLVYAQSAASVSTGPEIPGTRTVLSFQVLNPTGVSVAGGPVTCTGGTNCLLLNTGTLFTTGANLFTVGNTTAGSLAGGTGASYVNGPLARTLPASIVAAVTYTFPVGKSAFKMLELVNPTTNAGGTVVVQTEVFDANSGGTAGAGLASINTNRYWNATITAGAGNFTNTTVRLTEQGTPAVNAIGQSATQGGAYASIGGTVTPPTIGPSSAVTTLDFFVVGTLAGAPTICGNSNVGVGGDFTTLTAAVAALNTRLMTCPVTFTLIDNTYPGETFPIVISPNGGASAVNTLTIKPASGITPAFTGSAATALLILNGADYVTIDGSNSVGGSTRDTSFMNTSASTTSAVIWGQTLGTNDPATNNTIKNLNVAGNAPTTTLVGIGFGSATIGLGSVGTRNDNNRVQNNAVASLQVGVFSQGASSALKNVGTVITGNVLGGAATAALGRAGIFVGFDDGAQITNNTVNGVNGAVASVDAFGIALGSIAISATAFTTNNDVANVVVTGNVIGPVVKTDTFAAVGISMATNNYGTSRIANNVVFGVVANGTSGDLCIGIYVGNAGTAYSTTQVYYNSVSMTGPRDGVGLATQPSFAFAILGNNPLVDLRNNVFFNTQTAANGGPGGAAGSYAIGLTSTTPYTNFTSNYNDLFTSGASSHFAMNTSLTSLTGDQPTLAAWQAAVGKDANSLSVDPLFVSTTNLHLQPTSPVIAKGTPIAGVTTDIDNQPRDLTAPDIGADELVPRPVDVSVTKTDGVTNATPGASVTYTITAANAGPGAVPSATVTDTFPAVLSCSWTCVGSGGGTCTAAGAGNINDSANLPAGASVTYTALCNIASSATGALANTATVSGGPGDTNPGNDSATDTDTLVPAADAAITKTDGVTVVTAGGATTYTIVASNSGPSDTTGTVADTFPATLTCTWTCVGAGGGTCTGAGAGNINDSVTLPAGGSVTYTVPCSISLAATGTIVNTATVTAAADTNGANDSATDTDTIFVPAAGVDFLREIEPNNTFGTATALGGTQVTVIANVYPANDVDFFSFTAALGDQVYAATQTQFEASASGDSVIDLLDTDGTTLIEGDNNDGSFNGSSSSIAGRTIPAAGTYFLRVRHNLATGTIRPYYLHFRLQSGLPVPELEPNNSTASATPLPPSGWVSGTVTAVSPGETDFFSLTLSQGDTVFLSLDMNPERDANVWNGRLGFGLFGNPPAGQILLANDANTGATATDPNSEAHFFTVKTSGTYYVYVDSIVAAGLGPNATYTLNVSVNGKPAPTGSCTTYTSTDVPKTIPATAPPITVTSTLTVPGNPRIEDLDISINLNHTFMNDIDFHLTSPAGNDNGFLTDIGNATSGSLQTLMDMNVDDEAGLPQVYALSASYNAQPELNYRLSWFDGEDAGGTWTLTLRDDANLDGGTLNSWSITICEPPPPPACPPGTSLTTVFTTDFEAGDAGFTHTGTADEWERGLPATVATGTTNPVAAFLNCASGTNCWKTDLDNTYDINSAQNLLSPSINLAGLQAPVTVSWSQRYQMESASSDHMFVDYQQVGGATPVRLFEHLDATMTNAVGQTPVINIGESSGWSRVTRRADSLAGMNTELLFHLDSNGTNNFGGLAIDDVTITACTPPVASADLSITKTDGVTTATPGGSVVYTITASNAGPDPSTGTVADTFPASLACNWTCVGAGGGLCTAGPTAGNINDPVTLPVGASVTYTATCSISAAATGSLVNTATVTNTGTSDPTPGNNSATDTDTLVPSADAAITKTDGVTNATPGGSTTYTITASNAGPSNTTGTVADTFPASLTCNWTCVGAGGGLCTAGPTAGNINDPVTLPAGGSVTYTATCSISASATGSLVNTATVSTTATDPTPGNNSATDTDTLVPSADASITKTDGVTNATPGGSVTYTITASNAGPSNTTGTVADTFPASLTCNWTCVGAGGGLCTAGPTAGNINDPVTLPAGGSVTYTASCTISAAATGSLVNTATVTGVASDPTPGNNSATDTDTLVPSADAAITKTDGVGTATPGQSTTYTITASNAGPSDTTGTVADTFPAELTGCTWTCVGAGGGICAASGVGNINDAVTLPSGGSVTYTVPCNIVSSATGTVGNTATVTGAATDPTPGNNSATDSDTLTPSADLSLGLSDAPDPIGVHRDLTYTLTVTNNGPSDSAGITLTDTLPVGTTFVSSTPGSPTCGHAAGVVTCNLGGLGAFSALRAPEGGGQTTVTIVVSTTSTGTPNDSASVSASTSDPNSGNNSANTTTTVRFLKGDLDNDLNTELFIANTTNNQHRAWLMNGVLQSADSAINPSTPASATQQVYGVDDFDGDFRNDLVFWNTATGAVEFWLMNGLNRIGSPVPISGAPTLAPNWKLSATAEFNHDAKPDIVWRNTVSQKIVIWTMNGTTRLGAIIPTPDLAINSNWEIVAALDLNADGNTDFLWYNSTSGKIVYWWMDANVVRITGNFTTPDAAGNNNWKVLAGGDYGIGPGGIANTNDIVWRNATSGKFVVWYMDNAGIRTNGTFTTPDQPSGTPTDWIIVGPR